MDDRKKQIGDLERQKKEQAAILDSLLVRIGETFFGRIAGVQEDVSGGESQFSASAVGASFGELADYRSFQDDIAASEASIQDVEEQIRRFRELEEGIEAREREESAFIHEMAHMHGSLGKMLLDASAAGSDSPSYADFCAPYRDQAEALFSKIESLEERISALEHREGGNVFTWIGKSAQGLVLRSFLTKAHENLDQLRRNVGERYSRDIGRISGGDQTSLYGEAAEIYRLCTDAEQKREELRAISQDLDTLKEEKRAISGSFSAEGGPLKQIQSLKKHIARVHDELKALYRRIGAEAASVGNESDGSSAEARHDEGSLSERRRIFDAFLGTEDQETVDSAARVNAAIQRAEADIAKIRASIAIDDEKVKIEKFRKMIQDRKNKIAQAEKNIAEFEAAIQDSEASIEKLRDLL